MKQLKYNSILLLEQHGIHLFTKAAYVILTFTRVVYDIHLFTKVAHNIHTLTGPA